MKEKVPIYISTRSPFEIRQETLEEACKAVCAFCNAENEEVMYAQRKPGDWVMWKHPGWNNEYCQASILRERMYKEAQEQKKKPQKTK
jgi:hypothetical protein